MARPPGILVARRRRGAAPRTSCRDHAFVVEVWTCPACRMIFEERQDALRALDARQAAEAEARAA